jgi:hypothetical protein
MRSASSTLWPRHLAAQHGGDRAGAEKIDKSEPPF